MTTWEQSTRHGPSPPARVSASRPVWLVAGCLAALSLAGGSYRVLLAVSTVPSRPRPVAGLLEASPAARQSLLPVGRSGAVSARPARAPAAADRPAYVVSVARFTSRVEAEGFARRVRAKGYLASVVREGAAWRVVTRSYPSQDAAVRAARVLTEIGFSARVLAVRQPLLAPRDENSRAGVHG